MSGPPSLPPDVGQWPGDPYELLGVPRRAAPDEVRAAHDRLAAAFDPARSPEPCRRLRAALDTVLLDLDLRSLLDAPPSLELGPGSGPASGESGPALPPGAVAATLLPPRCDPAVGLWQMALSGREAEAYRGLVGLLGPGGAAEEVYLRLYWLLTAMPELDPERTPLDWLADGLRAAGLAGPLWELYRRALADAPDEALSPRCAALFDAPAEPDGLAELVQARWPTVAQGQRWDVMTTDLEALRRHLPSSERAAWARVWAAALDQLVWSDEKAARALATVCFQSIGELDSVTPPVTEARQRVNLARDLAAGWRKLRSNPEVSPPLLALVPPSWSRPFAAVRPALLAFLADALRAPRSLLRALDAAQEQPTVLAQFGRLLEQLQETLPPPPIEARSSSDLAELVYAFCDTAERRPYRAFRAPLLDFCLREAVAPETVAELTEDNPHYAHAGGHLAQMVGADEPLRLVCLAHRLFWA